MAAAPSLAKEALDGDILPLASMEEYVAFKAKLQEADFKSKVVC